MNEAQSPRTVPKTQRVIVTMGGASIFFASVIALVSGFFDAKIPDATVAITSFALGAVTAFWVLHGEKSRNQ